MIDHHLAHAVLELLGRSALVAVAFAVVLVLLPLCLDLAEGT